MFGLTIEQLGFIVRGAGWTILLSLLVVVGGTLVGVPIALARSSNNRWLPRLSAAFVQLVQGIPLPVIMFVVYFGISIGGFDIPALVAAVAPVVGGFADRLPRRAFLVAMDLVRAGIALLLPFVDQVWQVYVLIFVLQSASAAFTPTFQATIPDVLPEERDYTRALSLSR